MGDRGNSETPGDSKRGSSCHCRCEGTKRLNRGWSCFCKSPYLFVDVGRYSVDREHVVKIVVERLKVPVHGSMCCIRGVCKGTRKVLLKILSVNNHELWRLEDCLDRDGEGRLQNVREERAMLHGAELCENLAQGVERVGGASCRRLKQGPKDVNSIRRQMFFDDRDDSSQRIDCFGFKMTVHVRSGLAKGLGV